MKIYVKQKVFSWRDRFTVTDEEGNDKYIVEGEIFSLGKKLHIYDMFDREVALVKQKVPSLMPNFQVFCGGEQLAEIRKKFTLLFSKYIVEGLGWEVSGNFTEHDYEIKQGGRKIASIHKKWMSWGDTYELDIENSQNEILALAVVLTIDCVTDTEDENNAEAVD